MSDVDRPGRNAYGPERGSDPYRRWDAAYVLGALSPSERREFEEHLATCPTCSGEVAEIAGMPGLLAQLSPEDAALLADPGEPWPDVPVPASDDHGDSVVDPSRLERQRRRLTRAVVALAAAVVLLAGVVGVSVVRGTSADERPVAGPFRLAFSPVVPTDITAVVDVVPLPTGTELNVECQYADEGSGPSPTGRGYDIVVVDDSGHSTPVKTWTARPAHKMTPSGTSSLPVSEIVRVEIRPEGKPQALLRAELR